MDTKRMIFELAYRFNVDAKKANDAHTSTDFNYAENEVIKYFSLHSEYKEWLRKKYSKNRTAHQLSL